MRIEDIPNFPGYISVAQAAKRLGMSKVGVYHKIYNQEAFRTVFKLAGGDDKHERPAIMLLETEVEEVRARDQAEREARAARGEPHYMRIKSWTRRIKAWGRETNWRGGEVIHDHGRPHLDLIADYLAAHPDDPRPE